MSDRPPPLDDQLVRVAPDGLLLASELVQEPQGHDGALRSLVLLGGSPASAWNVIKYFHLNN